VHFHFAGYEEFLPMRKSWSPLSAAAAILLAMTPHLAKAGPCSGGIAELETAVQQFGGKVPSQLDQSVSTQPDRHPLPDLPMRLQSQFAATVARAKRLDMQGERIGCIGALNAARHMYVLVARQ
jgi:hypothetical protein